MTPHPGPRKVRLSPGGTLPTLSIIVPVYNERQTAGTLLRAVLDAPVPEGIERDVVVVDDASTDGTAEVLAPFAEDPAVARP